MSRAFCIPAIFFLFSAFVLLFIVSISLPYLTAMDITRVHTNGTVQVTGDQPLTQLRVSQPTFFGSAFDTLPPVGYLVRRLRDSSRVLPLPVHRSYCYTVSNGNMECSSTGQPPFSGPSFTSHSISTHRPRLFSFDSKRREQHRLHRPLVDPWSCRSSCWYVALFTFEPVSLLTTFILRSSI